MLKIVNFSKQYGSKIAVSNLNLLVQKGDIMGFIGRNGAGKTTTLKACMGIIRPTTGDIYVNDVSIGNINVFNNTVHEGNEILIIGCFIRLHNLT